MTPRDPAPLDAADDDDALHWSGDEARGQAAPRLGDADAASEAPELEADDDADPIIPRGAAARGLLAGTVLFGLVYLALSIGWISAVQLLVYPSFDLLGEIMWQFGEFLAMVAPALWFAAVLTLTPEGARRRGLTRMLGLLLGAAVLVPWPSLLYWIGSMQ